MRDRSEDEGEEGGRDRMASRRFATGSAGVRKTKYARTKTVADNEHAAATNAFGCFVFQ
ncbi:MAG: hypothetical protein QG650_702 [Patescibacteria group bacterium]|nr:hypothetical protein [Patescibacteria group bacterium]